MFIKEEGDKITKRAVLGKWLYELYQAQGEKGTNYDDETIIKRVTGFEHCESLIPIPRFYVGCDHEKYKEDCLQALSRLYDIMESRQNKLVIQKNKNPNYKTNPLKFQGLKDFTASFTNEELENLGADTPAQKRLVMKRLVNEYFKHLTDNGGMDLVIATHVYKDKTSDCHIKCIRFDKRGMVFNEHNLHNRMMDSLIYMHNKKEYKGKLIRPKNLRETIPHKRAKEELTESQKLEISRRILALNPKWVSDIKDDEIAVFLQMKSGQRTAVDYTKRKYIQDKDQINSLHVEFKGYKFYSNILTPEADRRLQLILEAEKLMEKKGIDLHSIKDKLQNNFNNCNSFEDFTSQSLEDGIRILPVTNKDKHTKETRITGFVIHPIGLNKELKLSLFDIDLFKRYALDKFNQVDMNRMLNEGIKHRESYAQFTAGEMKLKFGETIDAKLAALRDAQAEKYLGTFSQIGNVYTYKNSHTPSFVFDEKSGSATLHKMNTSAIHGLGSLFVKSGSIELLVSGVSRKEVEEIYMIFGLVKGITVRNQHIDEKMKSKLNVAIMEKAIKQHKIELGRLESKIRNNTGKPVTTVNIMPIYAENKTVLTYENVWMMLDTVAKMNIDLKKISSQVFVDNERYLKERFSNNKAVLEYVQTRINRHSQDLETKSKAYDDLKHKANSGNFVKQNKNDIINK